MIHNYVLLHCSAFVDWCCPALRGSLCDAQVNEWLCKMNILKSMRVHWLTGHSPGGMACLTLGPTINTILLLEAGKQLLTAVILSCRVTAMMRKELCLAASFRNRSRACRWVAMVLGLGYQILTCCWAHLHMPNAASMLSHCTVLLCLTLHEPSA